MSGGRYRTTGVIGVAVRGVARDTVIRRLVHVPFGWRSTTLLVSVRRYRCGGCGHVWRQNTSRAAEPRSKLPRAALRWALVAVVVQHLTMARIAEALAVSWNTTNDAVLAEGRRVLIDDPARFDRDHHRRRRRTCVAPHPPRRQVRHRDHRPDPDPGRDRTGQVARHGRGPLQGRVQRRGWRSAPRRGAMGWSSKPPWTRNSTSAWATTSTTPSATGRATPATAPGLIDCADRSRAVVRVVCPVGGWSRPAG